jgi:hypothetical protein
VLENFSPDWNHLNVRGQAAAAELVWPVVVDLLGLVNGSAFAVSSTELESRHSKEPTIGTPARSEPRLT